MATLNEQEARNALRQASDRLPSDAPFVLVERNGSYLPHVLRSLQSGHGKQKEGGGLWRSAQELRRHLELSGLGLEEVRGLAQGARLGPLGGMVARRLPGPGAPWLVVVGRKV